MISVLHPPEEKGRMGIVRKVKKGKPYKDTQKRV